MNEYNTYFILPLLGHPYPVIKDFYINCYISSNYETIYVESTNKIRDLMGYEYFYYDLKVFYIIPVPTNILPIIKLMYEGEWKKVLNKYPDAIKVINSTSGLLYYKKRKDNATETSKKLLQLNRKETGFALLQKEYERFGVEINIEDEYLPPLKEDKMNFVFSRLKDTFVEDYKIHTDKLRKRDLYKVNSL